MRIALTAASLLTPDETIADPLVLIEDGRVTRVSSRASGTLPENAQRIDFPAAMLVPSYVDIHNHGAMGHDVMEGTSTALDAVGSFLVRRGVAAYLPTTMTAPVESILRSLEGIARHIEKPRNEGSPSAKPLGIHLEGPFLSHARRGVHPPENLQEPSIELLTRFWEAARGHILLMTVAPELPNAIEFIRHATKLGIRVSMGHSDADTSQAEAGIEAGARSATHTFNAMRPLDHRDPGILGVVLDRDDLFAELICDGIHVDPRVVRLFSKVKHADRAILITDAMSATGMPDGIYELGDLKVTVANGRCLYQGSLAGSVLTLDRGVQNFVRFTGRGWDAAARYASTNPANLVGAGGDYGVVAPGRPANITVLSPAGDVISMLLDGMPVPA